MDNGMAQEGAQEAAGEAGVVMVGRMPTEREEVLERLRKVIAAGGDEGERPDEVFVDRLRAEPVLFQYRMAMNEAHIKALADALKSGRPLEPLLVLAVGREAVVIDGHHRLAAYRMMGWTNPIPVVWFEGPLEKAVSEGAKGNSRNKLPMSKQEKMDAAWVLVLEDEWSGLSKAQIATASGTSTSQVGKMRATKKALGDGAWHHRQWWAARSAGDERRDWSRMSEEEKEMRLEEQAERDAGTMAKAFGTLLANDTERMARMLEWHCGRRMEELIRVMAGRADLGVIGSDDLDDLDDLEPDF